VGIMDNKRVKYISNIMPPNGVNKHTYYDIEINNADKTVIVNGSNKNLEYSFEEVQKLFTPEVGTWVTLLVNPIAKVEVSTETVETKIENKETETIAPIIKKEVY
jgi:hypothetical protein